MLDKHTGRNCFLRFWFNLAGLKVNTLIYVLTEIKRSYEAAKNIGD